MIRLELQNEIMENIKNLKEDNIRKGLDVALSLKYRQKDKMSNISFKKNKNDIKLLLEFGNGFFDGEDSPNDTASEHDKYLCGI